MALFNKLFGTSYYDDWKKLWDAYYRAKAECEYEYRTEKRKEEVRRFKASLDNGENFKANFEPNSKSDDGFNWDMFKNEH